MSAVDRRPGRPRSEAADQAILEATVELIREQGFLALTIEAVAARAGVAKTTVYRRWSNKDDLLMDAVGYIKPVPPAPPGESVRDDLLFMLKGMRDGWFDGGMGRLMGRLAADGIERPDLYRQGREKFVAPRHAALQRVIQRGIDEGSIRADVDRAWLCEVLCAPIIAASLTHHDALTGQQLEFVCDTVLRGVAP